MANPLFSPIFAPGMQGGAYIIVYGISTNKSQKSFLNENMQAHVGMELSKINQARWE